MIQMDYYRTCESCKCYGTPTCGRCFMWSMYKPIMECVRGRNKRKSVREGGECEKEALRTQ